MKKNNLSKGNASKKTNGKKQTNQPTDESSMLRTLFIDGLKDIYWAEKHLTKELPKMEEAATTDQLKDAFNDHLAVTEEQVSRLEQVFELLEEKAVAKKCDAMEGLTKEAASIIDETEEGTLTRDAGLIMAAQKVEHYEIATYGSLAQLARTLGENEVVQLLEQTLEEEKETDLQLTDIAEESINEDALLESPELMDAEEE